MPERSIVLCTANIVVSNQTEFRSNNQHPQTQGCVCKYTQRKSLILTLLLNVDPNFSSTIIHDCKHWKIFQHIDDNNTPL